MEDDEMPKRVGQRIATLRAQKGLSQAEFTRLVTGKARSATASDWEAGKKLLDARNLARIVQEFGVSADWLLFGGNEEPVAVEPIGDAERKELLDMLDLVRDAVAKGGARPTATERRDPKGLRGSRLTGPDEDTRGGLGGG